MNVCQGTESQKKDAAVEILKGNCLVIILEQYVEFPSVFQWSCSALKIMAEDFEF